MILPDEVTEPTTDDTQSVEFDLDTLVAQFITPIERKRSHGAPNSLSSTVSRDQENGANPYTTAIQNDLNNTSIDSTTAQESRAHAFYRMLGLPVIDTFGNIYNPGFNPNRSSDAKTRNQNIASNISQNIIQLQRQREINARKRNSMFKNDLVDSSVFALVQLYPKKFQVMNSVANYNDFDAQQFTIPARNDLVANYVQADGTPITNTFSSYSHILRPFVVNPVIEHTVQATGRQARICEPFLPDKQSTLLENQTYLERPGIEFVLRLRLKEQLLLDEAINNVALNLSTSTPDTSGFTQAQIAQVAFAILDQQNITNANITALLNTYNNFELANLNKLVRLINASVDELKLALNTLGMVYSKLNWTPLPGEFGLEQAGKLEESTVIQLINPLSALERNITILQLISGIAKTNGVTSDVDIGKFAISFFENTDSIFSDELNDLNAQKLSLIQQGANAIRTIEVICGEQSGLGLIDILAIYTALWAIDLDVLISLLDNEAFNRLYNNNPDLINSNVTARHSNNAALVTPSDALTIFENQIINILDFADKRLQQVMSSPDTAEGGLIPQGS